MSPEVTSDNGDEEKKAAYKAKIVRALTINMITNVIGVAFPLNADLDLYTTQLFKGDSGAAAAAMTKVAGLSGLVEFAFNPTLGVVSDSIGRRALFIVPPIISAICSVVMALGQKRGATLLMSVNLLRRTLVTWSGSVATMMMLGDITSGKEYGMLFAQIFGSAGFGMIIAPALSMAVYKAVPSTSLIYFLGAGACLLSAGNNYLNLPETLPRERRKPFAGFVNPLAFLKLFTYNTQMSKTVLAAGATSFAEGKNLHELTMIWLRNNVGLSTNQVSVYIICWGSMLIFGNAKLAPLMLRGLGVRLFTTLTNSANALNYFMQTLLPKSSYPIPMIALAMTFFAPGMNGTNGSGLKGWGTTHAIRAGLGSGEYAGLFANLRALTVALAPLLYGRVYNNLTKNNLNAGLVWAAVAGLGSIAPEILMRTVRDPEDEKKP